MCSSDLRSQDLERTYHDAGQLYWKNIDAFKKNKDIATANTFGYIVPGLEVQDIDTIDDWKIAESKFRLIFDTNNNSTNS